jgi:Zn-dependent peptidase ImmA (M78 family)
MASEKLRPYESAEWQARKFGSLFLMPEHIVREFQTIRELTEACQVSFQAAEIRFSEVGHAKPKQVAPCVQEFLDSINKQA